MDTTAAYDLWSETYDHDGNFLQALDSIEMRSLLPRALSNFQNSQSMKIIDLGCGTGRNTMLLLDIPRATVVGLDASKKMLEIARARFSKSSIEPRKAAMLQLEVYDLFGNSPPLAIALGADFLISTLVLEHVPLPIFFSAVRQILKPNGIALVTNMHSNMGAISQAGFVDPSSGAKIRPTSIAHQLCDVIAEAHKQGFEILGDVLEKSVDEKLSEILGVRSRKWIGVTVWFGVLFRMCPIQRSSKSHNKLKSTQVYLATVPHEY